MRLRRNNSAKKELWKDSALLLETIVPKSDSVIEIGTGKGKMLCQMAEKNPHQLFFGVEKVQMVLFQALRKSEELKLRNIFFVVADAENIDEIVLKSCGTIWLSFPDPWPKTRHTKRRLTHHYFLKKYKKILGTKGTLKFKSDVEGLFLFSLKHLKLARAKVIFQSNDLHNSSKKTENFYSNYEEKAITQGKKIFYFEAKFVSNWNIFAWIRWIQAFFQSSKHDRI